MADRTGSCGEGIGCAFVILAICAFMLTLHHIGCIQNEPKAQVESSH